MEENTFTMDNDGEVNNQWMSDPLSNKNQTITDSEIAATRIKIEMEECFDTEGEVNNVWVSDPLSNENQKIMESGMADTRIKIELEENPLHTDQGVSNEWVNVEVKVDPFDMEEVNEQEDGLVTESFPSEINPNKDKKLIKMQDIRDLHKKGIKVAQKLASITASSRKVPQNIHLANVDQADSKIADSEPREHVCPTCSKSFLNKKSLVRHLKKHTGVRPFVCEICKKDFLLNYQLKAHMSIHTDEKSHVCDICNKSFISKYKLIAHLNIHKDISQRKYKCDICNQEYVNIYKHRKTHFKEKTHICTICNQGFRTLSDLKVHFNIHIPQIECKNCGKHFNNKDALRKHLTVECTEQQYICNKDECGKIFKSRLELSTHKNLSHDDRPRPYICDICKKAFMAKKHLRIHVVLCHTDDRPFKCDQCEKGFLCKSDLSAHIRSHTGEQPFACEICFKRFTFVSSHRRHMRKHGIGNETQKTEKKSNSHKVQRRYAHKCEVCEKGYINKTDLANHMRSHTGEQPYRCGICGTRFRYACSYRKHVKKHADDKELQNVENNSESMNDDLDYSDTLEVLIKEEKPESEDSNNMSEIVT